eukprot:152236_1
MGNTKSKRKSLKTYEKLISMGFDNKLSWEASQKYGNNLDKCMNFIISSTDYNANFNQHRMEKSISEKQEENDECVVSKEASSVHDKMKSVDAPISEGNMLNENDYEMQLCALGFPIHLVRRALELTANNKEYALEWLLSDEFQLLDDGAIQDVSDPNMNDTSPSDILINTNPDAKHNVNPSQIVGSKGGVSQQQLQPIDLCTEVNNCPCIKRIAEVLVLFNEAKHSCDERVIDKMMYEIDSEYGMTNMLNDYIHIVKDHGN